MRHFLDIDDLDAGSLEAVLDLADVAQPPPVLAGGGVALIFEKPSNRTRNATEMAVVGLGGHPVVIRADEIGLGRREPVSDIVRVLAAYHRVVGARVFDHRTLEAMAAPDVVPVLNLLSDASHPCQAIADLITLRRHWGSLEGRRLAWIGDGNNVAASLAFACALSGMGIGLACPPGHEIAPDVVDGVSALGGTITVDTDPRRVVAGADAVITDTWVSMGQEAEEQARLDAFAGYQVDDRLMGLASPDAVFLHCLPAHRGQEVTASVIDGPASLVFAEAANRLDAARAVLLWMLDTEPAGGRP
ncbi:MAG: ornithine carbamoyltransferase [Acidimicrobiales bacterium]